MLAVKLVRSLVLGETINNNPVVDDSSDSDQNDVVVATKPKTPLLLFLPTKELVTDTYRLATIARDMGFDLHPTPSLSHPPSSSPSTSFPSTWSSTSLSSSSSLPVPHLRAFVKLSRGLFKLVFAPAELIDSESASVESYWDCCSGSLFSRLAGDRIGTMEGFSRALAGAGWSLFKTRENDGGRSVYLFRKVDVNRVRDGECRIRELRLPALDFRNAPLRILQYILLMTDDMFYLA